MSEKTKNIIIRDCPEELHRNFKSFCALEPVSMSAKIIELMQNWVLEQKSYNLDRDKQEG